MIILFSTLVIILKSQTTLSDYFLTKHKKLSQFTVRLTGLNLIGHALYEELEMLLKHVNNVRIYIFLSLNLLGFRNPIRGR